MIARCEYRPRRDTRCSNEATRLLDTDHGAVSVCDEHARALEEMRCRTAPEKAACVASNCQRISDSSERDGIRE